MKVVIVVRSVTLEAAILFVAENIRGELLYFQSSGVISAGISAAYGVKQIRNTADHRRSTLHFIAVDATSNKLTFIKLLFHQTKNGMGELVATMPYAELCQATAFAQAYRNIYLSRAEYPHGWEAIYRDILLKLIPILKICDEENNTMKRRHRYKMPDLIRAA